MEIKISVGFSKARVESFYKFHYKKIDNYKYIEYLLVLIFLITAIISIHFNYMTGIILSLAIACSAFFTYSYRIFYVCKRELKKTPLGTEHYNVKITNDTIFYKHKDNESEHKWEIVKSFIEIDQSYFIYLGARKALIIPKFTLDNQKKEQLIKFTQEKGIYKKYKFYSIDEFEGVV